MPERGAKIFVAVSGGLDSMVLLHVLKRFSSAQRWKLAVAHFNHRLRGRASDADERFVRKTAAAMKLPFVTDGANVAEFAKASKISVEMAARKLRHEFLARAARAGRVRTIALAHHADDQVELFFLRLLRGAGSGSLAGMKPQSPSPADRRIILVRPLLECARNELEQFAREHMIRYREDATNLSTDFLRNRIRHELLPLLRKKYRSALDQSVLRLMKITGAEAEFIHDTARARLDHPGGDFEKLPAAVQREVVKLQLLEMGVTTDFNLIEALRLGTGNYIAVGPKLFVWRDAQGRIRLHEIHEGAFDSRRLAIKATPGGSTQFENARVRWQFSPRRKDWHLPSPGRPGVEFFDADKLGPEIVLRHWQAGDRFQPIGSKSPVKLQDLFTNKKIPRARRHQLLLAETNDEIFWIEGFRISENFKLTPQTKRLFIWRWARPSVRR